MVHILFEDRHRYIAKRKDAFIVLVVLFIVCNIANIHNNKDQLITCYKQIPIHQTF